LLRLGLTCDLTAKTKSTPIICHKPGHDPGRRWKDFAKRSTTNAIRFLPARNSQNLLANQAQGAKERFYKRIAGPTFLPTNLQVAPFSKSKICERRKANPTPLAAVLYGVDFYSDEPLPTSPQVPTFSEILRR
jgi:hypothetical protein